jgi:hypothetical protein
MPPQFLAIGHVVQDIVADGWRLGGAVSFASRLAARLGLRAAVLTSASSEVDVSALLPGVQVHCVPAQCMTQFQNIYRQGRRIQYLRAQAAFLVPEMMPSSWREAGIVLLGPVAGEVDAAFAHAFSGALLGLGAQGWLRQVGRGQRVRPLPPGAWDPAPLVGRALALFVSEEDLAPEEREGALAAWSRQVPALVFTRGEQGAGICHGGEWRHIDAFPSALVDATGGGDVFAAAFLIRFQEGGDVWEAPRYAACAASFAVEGEGAARLPGRQDIEARLAAHPEIVCRRPV